MRLAAISSASLPASLRPFGLTVFQFVDYDINHRNGVRQRPKDSFGAAGRVQVDDRAGIGHKAAAGQATRLGAPSASLSFAQVMEDFAQLDAVEKQQARELAFTRELAGGRLRPPAD